METLQLAFDLIPCGLENLARRIRMDYLTLQWTIFSLKSAWFDLSCLPCMSSICFMNMLKEIPVYWIPVVELQCAELQLLNSSVLNSRHQSEVGLRPLRCLGWSEPQVFLQELRDSRKPKALPNNHIGSRSQEIDRLDPNRFRAVHILVLQDPTPFYT